MRKLTWRAVVVGAAVVAFSLLPAMGEAQGVLFVEGGKVGIGQAAPAQPLHVYASNGTARLLVQEGSTAAGQRILLSLQNVGPGSAKIRMNSGGSAAWGFQTQGSGFAFSNITTGGSELFIGNDGSVRMGGGGASNFSLDPSGNLTIAGALTQNSSRTVKTDFETTDGAQILSQIADMPMSVWTYQNDHTASRHIGPMAEDFYSAFGLGTDGKHISPSDQAGVALAAIQGLNTVIIEKDREIDDLNARVDALEEMIGSFAANN